MSHEPMRHSQYSNNLGLGLAFILWVWVTALTRSLMTHRL